MNSTQNTKVSPIQHAMVWFGAGVSIAEILTGTLLAPLGMKKGLIAILLGHLIGGILLYFTGLIGGRTGKSAMEAAAISFGSRGNALFALLNVIQLVGWTAIMVYDGALSAEGIFHADKRIWAVVIGILILVWILLREREFKILSRISAAALFILTIILSVLIFRENASTEITEEALSFGAALELSIAMPLSWFPLISDYTRDAAKPAASSLASALTYSLVSIWMFVIGLGAALFAGTGDIAEILVKAGLGSVGLVIIILSTVTTTFLDAFSAGVSSETFLGAIRGSSADESNIGDSKPHPDSTGTEEINQHLAQKRKTEKVAAAAATILGTVLAILFPMDNITDFLYLIGSVFAPMVAVQLADYYFFYRKNGHSATHGSENGIEAKKAPGQHAIDVAGLFIWLAGFILYRVLMRFDLPCGSTIPDMGITMLLALAIRKLMNTFRS